MADGTTTETVKTALESALYVTALDGFSMADIPVKTTETALNAFRQPHTETVTWNTVKKEKSYTHTSATTYDYDAEHRLSRKTVTETIWNNTDNKEISAVTHVTEYFYNTTSKLVRTESYIEGKTNTLGKNIEETVYDENGHAVKSFSYNSLDPSSKFYTESETDENGITVADLDATGKNKTRYSYFANGLLASETAPNGGTLSYSYDKNGNVNAITQSSAEGEANSNSIFRTAGEVTKLVSGNNTVELSI